VSEYASARVTDQRGLYDHAPCGLFSCTLDGVVVEANETLLSLLGYERGEVIGASLEALLPPGEALFYETRFILALRLRSEVREVVLTLSGAGGRRVPVLVNARVQTRADGEPFIHGAALPIDERVDYERSLLDARRAAEATEERLRVLQEASAHFMTATSLDSLLTTFAATAQDSFAASATAVLLLDEDDRLSLAAGTHPLGGPLSDTETAPEWDAVRFQEAVSVANLEDADSMYPGLSALMRRARIASLTATPLVGDEGALGVVVWFFRRNDVIRESTLELQLALGRQLAQVVHRMQLQEERRRERRAAETLRQRMRQVAVRLRAATTPEAMVRLVAQGVGEALDVDAVRIAVLPEGDLTHLDEHWSADPTRAVASCSEAELRTLSTAVWSEEGASGPADPELGTAPVTSAGDRITALMGGDAHARWIVAPLGDRESVLGVIAVSTNDPDRSWTPIERSLIQNIATDLAHNLLLTSILIAQDENVRRLRQLDHEKNDLLATINHELRTPLTLITAYVDLIKEHFGERPPGRVGRMLDVVERNASWLNSLITRMMASAVEGPVSEQVQIGHVDVADLLEWVVQTVQPAAEMRGVGMLVESPGPLVVQGDREGLGQVLVNVIENAVKFSVPGGTVTVRAAGPSDDTPSSPVVVTVTDAGIGIPEADLSRVGTKLFRASNATREAVPGTGLGLWIVRQILSSSGGELALTSKVGVGTVATITLPAVDPRAV
jgi:two-component system phosphate regulon sensor histidine kinase PhoR